MHNPFYNHSLRRPQPGHFKLVRLPHSDLMQGTQLWQKAIVAFKDGT
jgi:hypothetical protein